MCYIESRVDNYVVSLKCLTPNFLYKRCNDKRKITTFWLKRSFFLRNFSFLRNFLEFYEKLIQILLTNSFIALPSQIRTYS